MRKLIYVLTVILIIGCGQNNQKRSDKENTPAEPKGSIGNGAVSPAIDFAQNIEKAHHKDEFLSHKAVSFNIALSFGGKLRLNGKLSMHTNSSKIRLDKADGSSLIFDGSQVYLSPADSEKKGARFDMFTWPYFFALPFKLTDPGTNWELTENQKLDSLSYPTAKLTFNNAVGDSPDDWYIIYQDRKTKRLRAAAYIVTFGRDKEEAEKNPHAIVYEDYTFSQGVPFAHTWKFYSWSGEKGLGKQLGEAKISNIKFYEPRAKEFSKPENATTIVKEKG